MLQEQLWARGGNKPIPWLVLWATKCLWDEGATWNRDWGGTDRDKSSAHSPRKRQESRGVCLFQLSAFLQSSDDFIYCVLIVTWVEPGVCCDPLVFGPMGKNTLFHLCTYIYILTHPFHRTHEVCTGLFLDDWHLAAELQMDFCVVSTDINHKILLIDQRVLCSWKFLVEAFVSSSS